MTIDFKLLQNAYNANINLILDQTGLTTECSLVYGVSDKEVCPNCFFDSLTNKSSNRYKDQSQGEGVWQMGPIPFDLGVVCPYCYGLGFVGKEKTFDNIYMAVLWDSKTWINFNTDIKNPDDYVQTICSAKLINKLESANYMVIKDIKFERQGSCNHAGLGDNNYVITTWRKTA